MKVISGRWTSEEVTASTSESSVLLACVHASCQKENSMQAWTETLGEYRARLKNCAAYINDNYDVEGLRRGLPKRLRTLGERRGDRINE